MFTDTSIAEIRLASQHIAQADFTSPEDVVRWMGAMQAQDYAGALWAIGLRMQSGTLPDIETAIAQRKIIRSWPMRGTLHFMAAEDARWMINLLAPRATKSAATRRKGLGIDDETLAKTREVFIKELSGKQPMSRPVLMKQLESHGIDTANQRGNHLLRYFAEQAFICFGPHEGKQPTFTLMDEWLPETPEVSREEALTKLAERYFTSHGPATLQDFAGWGYMTLADAREGIAGAANLTREIVEGTEYIYNPKTPAPTQGSSAYLLPGFDEYMLGYKDRSAALEAVHSQKIVPGGNGMFLPTIVLDGQVAGTWKRLARNSAIHISLQPFRPLSSTEREGVVAAAERYGTFMGSPVKIEG